MKIQPFVCGLLALAATPTLANEYPVSSLSLVFSVKCQAGAAPSFAISPNGYEAAPQVSKPPGEVANQIFGNRYEGEAQGFSYSLDSQGNVVFTKKALLDIFATESFITIGTPRAASMVAPCQENPKATSDLPQSVLIDLFPNIRVSETVDWSGICFLHSLWPNESGFAFYKPFSQSLTFTDTQTQDSVSITTETAADLGNSNQPSTSLETCNATALP